MRGGREISGRSEDALESAPSLRMYRQDSDEWTGIAGLLHLRKQLTWHDESHTFSKHSSMDISLFPSMDIKFASTAWLL
jgi:hypothetical protein